MKITEAAFAVTLAAGLLLVITGVARAQMFTSTAALEIKSMGELKQGLEQATIENKNKAKLKEMKQTAGRAFWNACFKYGVLERELLGRVASVGSAVGDSPANSEQFEEPDLGLKQCNCSYTSPKGSEVVARLNLKGSKKTVLFCSDSRNWDNYGKRGVLVAWSEGETQFLTAEMAAKDYQFEPAAWKFPTTYIIGKKSPFNGVYEDMTCEQYVNPDAPPKDVDYATVFKTKGRVIEQKATMKGKPSDTVLFKRLTIKELSDTQATVLWENLDAQGKPIGPEEEETLDLSDKSLGRPTARRVRDSEKEIEAAGRKWKVEKWTDTVDGNERTWWMSIEIPGLIVSFSAPKEEVEMTLVEFKDPEEK